MIDYETAIAFQRAYTVLLVLVGAFAAVRVVMKDDLALLLCAAVVIANWSVNSLVVELGGETDPTTVFLAVDLVSLAAVLFASWRHASGQLLASSYLAQILANSRHGLTGDDALRNWMLLTLIALGQLLLLAIWAALPGERQYEPV